HRSLDSETTMPSTNAPKPCDTSKNNVNVAMAWLRSASGALSTTSGNSDGYSSDTPIEYPNVDTYSPVDECQAHMARSPTDCSTMASDAPRIEPSRSGSRAPKIRTASTATAYSAKIKPELSSPTCLTYNGTKAEKPAN